jgi:tRNA G46 methylase TrmB
LVAASTSPDWPSAAGRRFIGAEPFINGVASLLRHIQQDDAIDNIRIWDDDDRLIFAASGGCSRWQVPM